MAVVNVILGLYLTDIQALSHIFQLEADQQISALLYKPEKMM